jgi:3-hydroxy-9,10-secoandrosta-1,3,5(10)-triene-9,17-dione monooxygenase reductase component
MVTDFSQKDFRNALGLFTTGVAIVTATGPANERIGFTINSFASVSLDPALILFSAGRHLRSYDAIENAAGFTINVLREDQKELSNRFARTGQDKWENVCSRPGLQGGHIIDNSLVSFDCRAHRSHVEGDHLIVIGEVIGLNAAPGHDPLVFFRSNYRGLEQNAEAPRLAQAA